MSEQAIFDDLATFFDDIPDAVRVEISFLLVVLADDHAVEMDGWFDYDRAAGNLFNAHGRFGRFDSLIKAIGVFDVYFAADPRDRFGAAIERLSLQCAEDGNKRLELVRNRYAGRLAAIEQARRDWQILRQTSLTSAAISGALMPQFVSTSKARASSFRAGRQARINQRTGP